MTIFNGKLVSHDLSYDLDQNWIHLSGSSDDFKIAYNIIFILEILMAQLTGVFDLTTTQAMQSEIHRTCMSIINTAQIQCFLNLYIISETFIYSSQISDLELKQQYNQLNDIPGPKNSRFKNITPYPGMSPDALTKYRVGFKFSIVGKIQTHPLYYSQRVAHHYKIDLNKVSSGMLDTISPFPLLMEDAIDFIRGRFSQMNPHITNSEIQFTDLTNLLRIQIENTIPSEAQSLDTESYNSPEEKKRAEMINQKIKDMLKKKRK